MKTRLIILVLAFISMAVIARAVVFRPVTIDDRSLREGDIIFHTGVRSSLTPQGMAMLKVTKSKWSHVGIIFKVRNDWFVYEAVQPVKYTPIREWIKRGLGRHYVIKRLRQADSILTPATITKMKQVGNTYKGRNYDVLYGWNDNKMYCSKLVWKIYKYGAGVEVGKLQKMRDFDFSNPLIHRIVNNLYKGHIPYDQTVISPQAVYDSTNLVEVMKD